MMSRKFELFEDPVELEKLRSEYEMWDQNKHKGALEMMFNFKKCPFWPLGTLGITGIFYTLVF
jgi:hypothetical protein